MNISNNESFYIKELDDYLFMYRRNIGSYQKLSKDFIELSQIADEKNICIQGFPQAILLDNPQDVAGDECTSEVGYKVNKVLNEQEKNVITKTMPSQTYYCATYYGCTKDIVEVYEELIKKVHEDGYFIAAPPIEIYLKNPLEAEQDGVCHIEIMIPIIKM
ncbi:GyrI-like domain-containing protein [Clostridium sporogenes]|uniref:GyrI-like domain-containing protein n=1 Tax=Clostridium sporogenes TaxID=1509 RepID=UPI0006B29BE7|nr:GyrI-like domain-containing protein [Clostridium sporogenes]KOY65418.1 hypothetical protein AN649_13140 [Clostridium sporogenes]MDS1006651.1 GyrI-like domain-containing protein [Clostridium sporogenes]